MKRTVRGPTGEKRSKPLTRSSPASAIVEGPALSSEWPFPIAVALGSSTRVKGIDREVRSKLHFQARPFLTSDATSFALRVPVAEEALFKAASETITRILTGIEALPVLPREAEEILTILPRERLKWTKDGRLQSAGTRTVKMRGRSKSVTFHVHDPSHVEEVLDRDLPTRWREMDAMEAAENRRRGTRQAALTRAGKSKGKAATAKRRETLESELEGWKLFDAEGLLR